MNEMMSLVSCPAFVHDHDNYKSQPCWGELNQENNVCTCTKCGAKYPMRDDWPLPLLFPNYHNFTSVDKDIKGIESRNFSQLSTLNRDWYEKVKGIPLPKQGEKVFKKPWKEYVEQVADVIGVGVKFPIGKDDKGEVSIGTAENEAYLYDPIVYFSNFEYFVEYYKPFFHVPELISDYIIACFAHEIGHLCPPSAGALDYLFYETNWGADNMKVNCNWGNMLEFWDESLANLNALSFYPANSERMRYIAISIYGGSELLHYEKSEDIEPGQCDFTSDEELLKVVKDTNTTVRIPSGFYKHILSYMGCFSWFNILDFGVSKFLFNEIRDIDKLVR